jgi:cyclic pyranopterin phosphate synthase
MISRSPGQLTDRFGRVITYVRMSVTDRCDFRCVYCMAEDMTFVPRSRVLTFEELTLVASAFVELGVQKIRLTGGEPLVRRDVVKLVEALNALTGLREIAMTSNASLLTRHAADLRRAGLRRLNISLDTLDSDRFHQITRTGDLKQVLAGIEAARDAGFTATKINTVILKNRNHDEVVSLFEFAAARQMDISFIEEMPLGVIGEHNRAETYYPSDQILTDLRGRYTLIPSSESTGGPSKYYRVAETGTRVGFISPHSHYFCGDCNRVRVTAEGRLLLCLGQEHSVDLRAVMRANPGDLELVKETIKSAMAIKPKGHEFLLGARPVILRHMNVTGG